MTKYDIKTIVNIKYLTVHHTGGVEDNKYASTQHHTAEDINTWHKLRWPDFKSELGWYGGYNFFIDKNGLVTQFRRVGEETAANKGHNLDAVSICLAGNFTKMVDEPTEQQTVKLKELLTYFYKSGIIKWENIIPHRALQYTECYGNGLSDTWARDLIIEERKKDVSRIIQELSDIIARLILLINKKKFGGHDRG